ncbi:hypothetical protein JTB14_034891 [Gonioctena quinquepunctata]|nr:hypothetical protein JTB14_034891 [Gonioctena quinquepunctata]
MAMFIIRAGIPVITAAISPAADSLDGTFRLISIWLEAHQAWGGAEIGRGLAPNFVRSVFSRQKSLSSHAIPPSESFTVSPEVSEIGDVKEEANKMAVEDVWQSYLRWPKIADSKRDKKVEIIMPFAIVSKEWKEYYDKKEKEKDMKINIAEQKKILKTKKIRNKKDENNENWNDDESEHQEKSDMENKNRGTEHGKFEIGDFVVVRYDDEYFPGKIENGENEEFEVSTMIQSNCGKLWEWPTPADRIWFEEMTSWKKIRRHKK